MHRGVEWLSPDTPIATVAKKMLEHDIGAIPIGENDRLVGMVTDRDITIRAVVQGKDISKLTARDVMTSGVIYCRDAEEIDAAHHGKQADRRLPVIDETSAWLELSPLAIFLMQGRATSRPKL
jgi:CBS domain-containing protein